MRFAILTLPLMVSLVSPAWAGVDESTLSKRIEQAGYKDDVQDLESVRTLLEAATKQPQPDKYLYYYLGYVDYALTNQYDYMGSSKATESVEAAQEALTAVLKVDPDSAEAEALLGSSYGLEIRLHPAKAMWLGPKASEHIDRAVSLAPNNPRVLMIKGFSDIGTPAIFGGDKERALWDFHAAIAAFDRYHASDSAAPSWGEALTYEQLARAEEDAGQAAAARADYGKAVELVPDYKLAQRYLAKLPPATTVAAPAHSSI